MRDWREGQGPGVSQPPRSRPLGNAGNGPPDRSYSRAGNTAPPRRQSGTDWGAPNQSQARRNDPNASYPRRGDPNQSHPRRGWDDPNNQALMVSPQDNDLMLPDERALPALPTEEEERAMGIRRPAFIPATEERKGKRPGRWRVISGAASVMLLFVGLCGVSGLLVQRNVFPYFSHLLGIKPPTSLSFSTPTINKAYQQTKTLATPGPTNTPINNVVTTTAVSQDPNKLIQPTGPITPLYIVNDQINLLFNVNQSAKNNDVVSVHWIFNNVDITSTLPANKTHFTITNNKSGYEVDFALNLPQVGYGEALLYYNSTLAYTVLFAVVAAPSTATPAASPTTKPSPTATSHP